ERACCGRWVNGLRTELCGLVSSCCQLRGQNTERCQACRFAGGAADQVRVRHQPQDRQDAWSDHSARRAGHRRRGDRMSSRRAFISLLGGAAAAWPLAARAQQQSKMLRVGFVGMLPRDAPHYANFLKRMAELGYQEGRNFTFDYIQTPNVEGYEKNYRELAARKVDVFLA